MLPIFNRVTLPAIVCLVRPKSPNAYFSQNLFNIHAFVFALEYKHFLQGDVNIFVFPFETRFKRIP